MGFKLLCKGDYSQGSTKFSAESRGKQCVSMCFRFLLTTLIVDVNKWTKQELHNVLDTGDVLYKDIRTKSSVYSDYEYLHPMELPENILFQETDKKNRFVPSFCKLSVAFVVKTMLEIFLIHLYFT